MKRAHDTNINYMPYFLIALAAWSATGVLFAWLLRRQGHNAAIYMGLAGLFGPLILFFGLRVVADREHVVIELEPGSPGEGWIDVLVGLDGSVEAVDSVRPLLALVGPGLRRLRIVNVLDIETGSAPAHFGADIELSKYLKAARLALSEPRAELAILSGRPDKALVKHAIEEDIDLILVAHHRRTLLSTLLGNTVSRLARTSTVPIIVAAPAPRIQATTAQFLVDLTPSATTSPACNDVY